MIRAIHQKLIFVMNSNADKKEKLSFFETEKKKLNDLLKEFHDKEDLLNELSAQTILAFCLHQIAFNTFHDDLKKTASIEREAVDLMEKIKKMSSKDIINGINKTLGLENYFFNVFSKILIEMSTIEMHLKNYSASFDCMKKAVEINPNSMDVQYNYANACLEGAKKSNDRNLADKLLNEAYAALLKSGESNSVKEMCKKCSSINLCSAALKSKFSALAQKIGSRLDTIHIFYHRTIEALHLEENDFMLAESYISDGGMPPTAKLSNSFGSGMPNCVFRYISASANISRGRDYEIAMRMFFNSYLGDFANYSDFVINITMPPESGVLRNVNGVEIGVPLWEAFGIPGYQCISSDHSDEGGVLNIYIVLGAAILPPRYTEVWMNNYRTISTLLKNGINNMAAKLKIGSREPLTVLSDKAYINQRIQDTIDKTFETISDLNNNEKNYNTQTTIFGGTFSTICPKCKEQIKIGNESYNTIANGNIITICPKCSDKIAGLKCPHCNKIGFIIPVLYSKVEETVNCVYCKKTIDKFKQRKCEKCRQELFVFQLIQTRLLCTECFVSGYSKGCFAFAIISFIIYCLIKYLH